MSDADSKVEHRDDGDQANDKPSQIPPEFVEITRITEWYKTVRLVAILAAAVIGLAILTFGVVTLLAKPLWWQFLVTAIIGVLFPSPVIVVLLKSRRKYVRKTHRKIADLEKMKDGNRSSSDRNKGEKP